MHQDRKDNLVKKAFVYAVICDFCATFTWLLCALSVAVIDQENIAVVACSRYDLEL
jgi:hypothetical protein